MHTKKLKSLIKEMGLDHYRNDRVLSEQIPGTGPQPYGSPQSRRLDVSRPGAPQPQTRIPTSNPVSTPGATQPYGGPQSYSQPRVAPPGTGPQPPGGPQRSIPNVGQTGAPQPGNNFRATPRTINPNSFSPQGAPGATQPTVGSSPSTASAAPATSAPKTSFFGPALSGLFTGIGLGQLRSDLRRQYIHPHQPGRTSATPETPAAPAPATNAPPPATPAPAPPAASEKSLGDRVADENSRRAARDPTNKEGRFDSKGVLRRGDIGNAIPTADEIGDDVRAADARLAAREKALAPPAPAAPAAPQPPSEARKAFDRAIESGKTAKNLASRTDSQHPDEAPWSGQYADGPTVEPQTPAKPANPSPERTPSVRTTPQRVADAITKQTKTSSDSGSLSGYSDWAQDAFGRNRG